MANLGVRNNIFKRFFAFRMSVLLLVEHHKDNEKTVTTFFIRLIFAGKLKNRLEYRKEVDEVLRILNVYVEGKMICRSEGA